MKRLPSLGDYNGNFVHPRIAVGGCMRAKYVPLLVRAGIRGIVNVTGVAQKSHLIYIASLPNSIHWQMLGYWDGSWPFSGESSSVEVSLDPTHAEMIVNVTMRIVRDCSPVLIHCAGGISRSGNLAAIAVAALEDITPQKALERMRVYRPKLGDFSRERWKNCNVPRLVRMARKILAQPKGSTPIKMMQ